MPLERRELERTLRELGFVLSERDHEVFELYVNRRRIIYVQMSRGWAYRTLGEPILAKIAREMRVTRAFLYELVRGTKTKEDYLDELRKQGLL